MIQTRKSNSNRPPRVVIYGVEGAGKSTFGAKSDNPIFISPEGGTDQLTKIDGSPVDEMPNINSWESVCSAVETLIKEKHDFKTLVIDSLDWVETLAHKKIIGKSGKTIVTCNGGYGAGYRESQNLHSALISQLEILRETKNMNIIITAHAHVKPVKDPEMLEDYNAFEIKAHEFVSALAREWVDGLFFVRFRTFVKTGETATARAISDGTRIIYSQKQPAFQAKSRYKMPPSMEFTENFWNEFIQYTKKGIKPETIEEIISEMNEMASKITDDKLKETVFKSMSEAGTIEKLIPLLKRLREITGANN